MLVFAHVTRVYASLRLGLVLAPVLLCSSACEVVADFDPKRLNTDRTVGPVPLPSADGAVALIPDAGSLPDGALIGPEVSDAEAAHPADGGHDAGDAGWDLDAASALDAAGSSDAGERAEDAAPETDSALTGLLDAAG